MFMHDGAEEHAKGILKHYLARTAQDHFMQNMFVDFHEGVQRIQIKQKQMMDTK